MNFVMSPSASDSGTEIQYANSFHRRIAHAIHITIDDKSLSYQALAISHSSSLRLELQDMGCALSRWRRLYG